MITRPTAARLSVAHLRIDQISFSGFTYDFRGGLLLPTLPDAAFSNATPFQLSNAAFNFSPFTFDLLPRRFPGCPAARRSLDDRRPPTSGSRPTVIGASVYQVISILARGLGSASSRDNFAKHTSRFVDAATGNYFLASNSPAIDSSIDFLDERSALFEVLSAVGIESRASPRPPPIRWEFAELTIRMSNRRTASAITCLRIARVRRGPISPGRVPNSPTREIMILAAWIRIQPKTRSPCLTPRWPISRSL